MVEPEIRFRTLTRDDFPTLARWLARPHVARWWNHDHSAEAVERDFGPAVDGTDPTEMYVVLLGDRPIGFIQYSRFADFPDVSGGDRRVGRGARRSRHHRLLHR